MCRDSKLLLINLESKHFDHYETFPAEFNPVITLGRRIPGNRGPGRSRANIFIGFKEKDVKDES